MIDCIIPKLQTNGKNPSQYCFQMVEYCLNRRLKFALLSNGSTDFRL